MSWKSRVENTPLLWRLAAGSASPVGWVGLGRITTSIAQLLPPQQPPVLVLSLPRSGSSWVGEVLGSASNALYLREPITQSYKQLGRNQPTVLDIDPAHPDVDMARFANDAFNGIPDFFPDIIRDVSQWGLRSRSRRKVVIKEVNPLAAKWLTSAFNPFVILLVRHPAAVAASYQRLGWQNPPLADVSNSLERLKGGDGWQGALQSNSSDFWTRHGLMQGGSLHYALSVLQDYPNKAVVRYEDVCLDPAGYFRELFRSAGLDWNAQSGGLIRKKTIGDDQAGPYSTSRDTKSMPRAWAAKVTRDEADRLRAAFSKFDLPWYAADDDWQAEV